jgi:hypothetical protein
MTQIQEFTPARLLGVWERFGREWALIQDGPNRYWTPYKSGKLYPVLLGDVAEKGAAERPTGGGPWVRKCWTD